MSYNPIADETVLVPNFEWHLQYIYKNIFSGTYRQVHEVAIKELDNQADSVHAKVGLFIFLCKLCHVDQPS